MPRLRRASPTDEFEDDDECSRQGEKPGQRNAANARERARMRILSKAFSRLKTTLPWVPPDTKLSKLDTLRLATSYIAHLRTILTDESNTQPTVHPLNLTWPFTIQQHSPADISRSPGWSSDDLSPPHQHTGVIHHISETLQMTEGESDDSSSRNNSRELYSADHRHYSDSLLNIG